MDIAAVTTTGAIYIFQNNGSGGFTLTANSPISTGFSLTGAVAGDFKGHGGAPTDIAAIGPVVNANNYFNVPQSGSVVVILGNGNGMFVQNGGGGYGTLYQGTPNAAGLALTTYVNPAQLAVGSLGSSSYPDIVVADSGETYPTPTRRRRLGAGELSTGKRILPGCAAANLVHIGTVLRLANRRAELGGTGQDFWLFLPRYRRCFVFRWQVNSWRCCEIAGPTTFPVTPAATFPYGGQVAIADVNQDGAPDVVVLSDIVQVLLNTTGYAGASGILQPWDPSYTAGPAPLLPAAGPQPSLLAVGYLSGSSVPNVLVGDSQPAVDILLNSGSGGSGSGPSMASYSISGQLTGGPIDFVTNVNTATTQQLLLMNTGGAAFTISGISTAGIDAAFSVSNIVCPSGADFPFSNPVNLGPGQSCTITLQFAPTTYGNGHSDLLTILDTATNSNASASPQNNGQSILLLGDSTEPVATFSATALNFGNVNENTVATLPVTLTNTGNGPLTLAFVFVTLLGPNNTGFVPASVVCNGAAAQYPVTLYNNQSCTVMVQFDPTAATTFGTNLYFEDNAGQSNLPSTLTGSVYLQALPMAGVGLGPAMVPDNETITVTDNDTITPLINVAAPVAGFSAGSLGFGGADGSQTLTVSDIGLASLTIESATMSPSSPFAISGIACSNTATSFLMTLPSGGACILTIAYTGSSPGTDTGHADVH